MPLSRLLGLRGGMQGMRAILILQVIGYYLKYETN